MKMDGFAAGFMLGLLVTGCSAVPLVLRSEHTVEQRYEAAGCKLQHIEERWEVVKP